MNAFHLDRHGDGRYVVSGELTFATVPAVWRETREWFSEGGAIAVDLAGVSRADSAGLALLLEWLRSAKQRGAPVVFEHMPAQIRAIARLSALESVLDMDAAAG